MKRIFVVLIAGSIIWLASGACKNRSEQAQEGKEAAQEAFLRGGKRQTKVEKGAQRRGVGMVKDPTRLHPGWQCRSHPNIKSAYPGKCPIDGSPLVRIGEWTCSDYPQVSATGPGKCPYDGTDLVKVEDLEKKKGKTIEELTKETLTREKLAAEKKQE